MGQKLTFICLLVLTISTTFGQSHSIKNLIEEEKPELSLYFYPSTLRMINLQRNAEFDELIRDIRKMTFLKLDKRAFNHSNFRQLVNELISEENFEEYIVVEGNEHKLYLLGKESPPSTIGVAFYQKEYYAMDITGKINIKNLPKLYEQLSQNDSTFKNGFVNVFNVMSTHKENMDID